MLREVLMGVALKAATYADTAVRGQPSSGVPAEVAWRLLIEAGFDPSGDGETAQNRRNRLGALPGYVVGLGAASGLAAMSGSDVPAAALDVTDDVVFE